ncbi:hypothetical protein SD77_3680 [Bacillus badius]|uniref:Uncharacterized protein n=1 Tax=Bacillus badius TaxID=1455 RepID=A0ABR5AW53_BACBA|nr:hypothetical protein SD77_3680 [Bacillus badius]
MYSIRCPPFVCVSSTRFNKDSGMNPYEASSEVLSEKPSHTNEKL